MNHQMVVKTGGAGRAFWSSGGEVVNGIGSPYGLGPKGRGTWGVLADPKQAPALPIARCTQQ